MTLVNAGGRITQHLLRGQIAAPMGGGAPRLYLLSSMTRSDWTASQTGVEPSDVTSKYTSAITSSCLRACISLDFGQSFTRGIDVAVELQGGGALGDGRATSVEATYPPSPTPATSSGPGPATHIVPLTLIVTPQGRVFVRAYTDTYDPGALAGHYALFGGTAPTVQNQLWDGGAAATPLFSSTGMNETNAPRVCDDAFMLGAVNPTTGVRGPAFRDASTVNQTATLDSGGFVEYALGTVVQSADITYLFSVQSDNLEGIDPTVAAPSMNAPVWQPCSGLAGTKGLGQKVRGPSKLYMYMLDNSTGKGHYYASSDGGDTWEADDTILPTYTGAPYTGNEVGKASGLGTWPRDQIIPFGAGWFDNGIYASSMDVAINSPKQWYDSADEGTSYPYSWITFPYSGATVSASTHGVLYGQYGGPTKEGFPGCGFPGNTTPQVLSQESGGGAPPYFTANCRGGQHHSADDIDGTRLQWYTPETGWNYCLPGGASGDVDAVIGMGVPAELAGIWCYSLGGAASEAGPTASSPFSGFAVAYTWNANIVIVYGINGTIQVIKSQDSGRTFTPTAWSDTNTETWNQGAHPGYG